VRRLWIDTVLPLLFCAVPVAMAALVAAAIPASARSEYVTRLRDSAIDWVILGIGGVLFFAQTWLARRALRWKDTNFDESADPWLSHLGQAAEWFPLLGLIGTVAAILQTFGTFGPGSRPAAEEIIQKYGPAITATGSGLFMAFLNILPGWMVIAGRNLIRSLAGVAPPPQPMVPLIPASPSASINPPPGGRA
jgi:MotA/TolQ/ExbB proton channel family